MSQNPNYPKDYQSFPEVYSHGGVRAYKVTLAQAEAIAKEFPDHFKYSTVVSPVTDNIVYINKNHGEAHLIISLA